LPIATHYEINFHIVEIMKLWSTLILLAMSVQI